MNVDTEVQQNPVGKVLLYTSWDDAKPAMTFKHKTTNQLPPILKRLAEKFSSIRSKYIYFLQVWQELSILSENDSHIFVQQDDDWDIKGRYSQAI